MQKCYTLVHTGYSPRCLEKTTQGTDSSVSMAVGRKQRAMREFIFIFFIFFYQQRVIQVGEGNSRS